MHRRKANALPPSEKIYNFHDPDSDVEHIVNCPVEKNLEDNDFYVQKILLGNNEVCPEKTQSKKDFHKDFFSFRDSVYNISTWRNDPVDKITSLYLDGNRSQARRYPNMKIKDLFDNLTSGPNLYERQCVRLPKYDNINPNGYRFSYGNPGMQSVRDNWEYPNEKIMNGGEIVNNIYGHEDYNQNNYNQKNMDQNNYLQSNVYH